MMNMPRLTSLLLVPVLLSGCVTDQPDASKQTLQLAPEGYRYKGDVCRIAGESPLTLDLLDDSYDLVACPDDITLVGNIAGAQELRHVQGYRIFSVSQQ